ncbi:uncharacterized protein BX663DRAFT_540322 [Cokeromyces recurvatus]|uniref:uncharacterized protein n=1 Tax=Cokeromyces recurvatus TaxID=90255 RepID=UPI0022201149|nr:uncharacterized protein BX663DRAFT_540322 [Cokeromyces recurvatus]KAI7906581.1 hypothetical protein BX663DRAFT_540322 [Cokeromyces recurvatus]
MLHIQEAFTIHNSNLLMSTTTTVIVQPQPSTSSRSTKVIEQLNIKYDTIQKELASIKVQLEVSRQTKLQYEKDISTHTACNKQYRARIKDIMQLLESKQKLLETTKILSNQLELKVKQLKDEALRSRHQLEGLRRQEQSLERVRDVAFKHKDQLQQHRRQLYISVDQFKLRCERELSSFESNYTTLMDYTCLIAKRNKQMIDSINNKLKLRQQAIKQLGLLRLQLKSNTESFMDHIRTKLEAIHIQQNISKNISTEATVLQYRDEFHSLLKRIKTAIAEELAAVATTEKKTISIL